MMPEERRLQRMEDKIDRLDEKLDEILVRQVSFVTWGKLGAALVAAITAAVGLSNLVA